MTYHTIMTQTLPTVVGMGVVSRTTETMFGKSKVGTGRRRSRVSVKVSAKTFAGKQYRAANWHATKKAADRDAEFLRKAGHLARVSRYYNERQKRWGYMVYIRR